MDTPRPRWLDAKEYPFASRYFQTLHGPMHYIDEGEGEVILLVHGNPTWSFLFRHIIRSLSRNYRCIAVDHIGFGLSAKPPRAPYTPQFHAENLRELIDGLGLRDITLVMHDWGGAISMSYALEHPKNIKRLVVFNNSFWSVKGVRAAERFSRIVGGPIGWIACHWFNAFPRFVLPALIARRERLTKTARRHYIAPLSAPASRRGTWVLAKAIIGASDWLASLWDRRDRLSAVPVLIMAGMKDPTFGTVKLERWEQAFPHHTTKRFEDVGHFVPEELGQAAVEPIEEFLAATTPALRAAHAVDHPESVP